MAETLRKIAENSLFQNFITAVILFAGVLVGIETYPAMVEAYHTPLHLLDQIVLWIFVAEVVVKMGAEGSKPWRYFLDPWNVFDFVIVAACFLPFAGSVRTVAAAAPPAACAEARARAAQAADPRRRAAQVHPLDGLRQHAVADALLRVRGRRRVHVW